MRDTWDIFIRYLLHTQLFVCLFFKTITMFYYPNSGGPRSFPELVNQYAQPAVSYIYSQGISYSFENTGKSLIRVI